MHSRRTRSNVIRVGGTHSWCDIEGMRALRELLTPAGCDGPGAGVENEGLMGLSDTAYDASIVGRPIPGIGVMFTAM
jgi:hypothetical protein